MKIQTLILFLAIPLLSSCGVFDRKIAPPEVIVKTVSVPVQIYQPPRPDGVQLLDITWFVITSNNYEEKIAELEAMQGGNAVVFAITPQDYESISYNLQEIRRFLRQQDKIITYYEKFTQAIDEVPADFEVEAEDKN